MAAWARLASEIGEAASDIGLGTTRAIAGGTTSRFHCLWNGLPKMSPSPSKEPTRQPNSITLGINGTTRGSWTDNATGASNGTAATFTFNEVFFTHASPRVDLTIFSRSDPGTFDRTAWRVRARFAFSAVAGRDAFLTFPRGCRVPPGIRVLVFRNGRGMD